MRMYINSKKKETRVNSEKQNYYGISSTFEDKSAKDNRNLTQECQISLILS